MMAVTNQHILGEIEKVRKILVGNGEPEKGVCFRLKESENKIVALEKCHCGNNGKVIFGVPASVRSEMWKWWIRIGNTAVWICIAYLVAWASRHGVEITNILKQIPK